MNSRFRFPCRVRIHGGECGAVARALHHEARISLPAVFEKVSSTTLERIQMSTKTSFKRIAFAVVVTLSLGMLGTAPSYAGTIIGETLTVDGSSTTVTSSITQGETAVVSVVSTFTPESTMDSLTVMTSCAAPAGGDCSPSGDGLYEFYWTASPDSTTNASATKWNLSSWANYDDSFTIASNVGSTATRFTASLRFRATADLTVGAYTITVYTKSSAGGATPAVTATNKSVTWTVNVAAQSTAVASLNTYVAPTAAQAQYWQDIFATSKDSAVVAASGKNAITGAVTPAAAAYIFANAKNAAGDTTTAAGTNICSSGCTITATVTNGPGTLGSGSLVAATSLKSTTFTTDNTKSTGASSETLTVYSDGTAGVTTITFYNSLGVSIGTASVTFTGAPASATSVSFSDTNVAVLATPTISAVIKDAAGNAIKTGTVYIYASDTKVVTSGAGSTDAAQYTQVASPLRGSGVACANGYSETTGRWSCSLTVGDTGTASITIRDSYSVAGSTWSSDAITLTGHGTAVNSVTVAFDKATYTAGEKATITITVKDTAGRNLGGSTATFSEMTSSMNLGSAIYTAGASGGTTLSTTFTNYIPANTGIDSGTETRVVFMPSNSGTTTIAIKYTPVASGSQPVTASASAVVVNPAETAASAAKDAADAATDAAAEAIDAANAATDAANLAAEAADAATVAAEEARDAADAATAAVEELATQVATLMAALKAQITTLANTVAKIAKKVKA